MAITEDKLKEILELHKKWLKRLPDGVRADLRFADLRYANLKGADLRCADLRYVNFEGAILVEAYLNYANLSFSDLSYANLTNANLNRTNLSGTSLIYTNLSGANLSYAINIPFIPQCDICPSEGAFIGWKKIDGYIIKLQIPEDAKRSNCTTRKCRCDKALVLSIQNEDGSKSDLTEITNYKYHPTTYKIGEMVYADSFDKNRWKECSHGIHFFITRQEAVEYWEEEGYDNKRILG